MALTHFLSQVSFVQALKCPGSESLRHGASPLGRLTNEIVFIFTKGAGASGWAYCLHGAAAGSSRRKHIAFLSAVFCVRRNAGETDRSFLKRALFHFLFLSDDGKMEPEVRGCAIKED